MKWASAVARSPNASEAVARACKDVRRTLGDGPVDFALFFVAPHFREAFELLHGWIQACLPARVVVGCSGGGVIGGGVEVEGAPAFSVIAARLPDVSVDVIHTDGLELPDADAAPSLWRQWLGLPDSEARHFLVLADPFSARLEPLLTGLDYAFPDSAKIGGVASGGRTAGEQALFNGPHLLRSGVLLIALGGEIAVDTLVAQGCRPIGRAVTVTRCENNVLLEVEDRPPLHYLAELVEESTPEDKELMRRSLLLGVQVDEPVDARADEFLIRNLVGIDYKRGILAASVGLRPGQLVQFHLRDRASAVDELRRLLAEYGGRRQPAPCGALLFSCLGRGQHLYQEVGHDSRLCRELVGDLPLAGFFCNGEIGPVAGATHIHGYTSAFAFFRPPDRRAGSPP